MCSVWLSPVLSKFMLKAGANGRREKGRHRRRRFYSVKCDLNEIQTYKTYLPILKKETLCPKEFQVKNMKIASSVAKYFGQKFIDTRKKDSGY